MGEADVNCACWLEASDWIDLAGIVVNAGLAIWIVRTIQNRLTNKRVLKDHFISEMKEVRNEYRTFLNKLHSDQIMPKTVISWFKLMNIKVNDILSICNKKYKIDKKLLLPYQRALQELVTNNDDFTSQFRGNSPIKFSESSKNSFIKFQQDHNHLFNEVIIAVNDSD